MKTVKSVDFKYLPDTVETCGKVNIMWQLILKTWTKTILYDHISPTQSNELIL